MNKIINFYEVIPKKYKTKTHNPNYSKHLIELPMRMLIVGASGSMKTNVCLNIIHKFTNTFNQIILCVRDANEPLYNFLSDKIGDDLIIYENGEVPSLSDFEPDGQKLIIFDDLINLKDQKQIEEFFLRGRKLGFSCIYIAQSYFKTPRFIRLNCTHIILKKIPSIRDIKTILKEYSLSMDADELYAKYKQATKNPTDFLLIDPSAPDDKKLRQNFLSFI